MKILQKRQKEDSEILVKHKELVESHYSDEQSVDSIESVLGPRDHIPIDLKNMASRVNPHYHDMFEESIVKNTSIYHNNCALCSTAMLLQLKGYNAEAMPLDVKHNNKLYRLGMEMTSSVVGHEAAMDKMGVTYRTPIDVFNVDFSDEDNTLFGPDHNWSFIKNDSALDVYTSLSKTHRLTLDKAETDSSSSFIEKQRAHNRNVTNMMESFQQQADAWGPGSFGEVCVVWKQGGGHSMVFVNEVQDDGDTSLTIIDAQTGKTYSTPEEKSDLFMRTNPFHFSAIRCDNAELKPDCEETLRKMCKPGTPYTEEECKIQIENVDKSVNPPKQGEPGSKFRDDDIIIHGITSDKINLLTNVHTGKESSKCMVFLPTNFVISTDETVRVEMHKDMLEQVGVDEKNQPIYDAHFNAERAMMYGVPVIVREYGMIDKVKSKNIHPIELAGYLTENRASCKDGKAQIQQPYLGLNDKIQEVVSSVEQNPAVKACLAKAEGIRDVTPDEQSTYLK